MALTLPQQLKKGACSDHGGVKDWYVAAAPVATAKKLPAATAAAGGGAGKVWVNTNSKTYHCSGSKWYGTTKSGSYMTEAVATAAVKHAAHSKACS